MHFPLTSTQKLRTLGKVGAVAALAAMVVTVGGCGDDPTKAESTKPGRTRPAGGDELALLDPKDDVMGAASGAGQAPSQSATRTSGATPARDGGKGRWSVILATFSGGDHAAKAAAFRGQIVTQYPELRDAAVRRVGKGSAIVSGRFEGPDESAAQAELKRVKAIERNGKKPFGGVMLMRTSAEDASGPPKPHDLRTLRAQFPTVRPLFTLQVAAWSTFGEKGLDYDDMRLAAENYCAELRKRGHDAWFLHDEDSETSIVAVGRFDRRAYDPKSTLFAPEVEELMRQFPANLVNGEPLLIPVDPRNPNGKTRPQPCRLVEVPAV